MQKINLELEDLGNKIAFKHKEINYEQDYERKMNLHKQLNVLYLRKEILGIKKK